MRQRVLAGTALVMVMFMPNAFATFTDGVYTGTTSGTYNTGTSCSGLGINSNGNVPFSGATATLTISNSGLNFQLNFSHPDFSLSSDTDFQSSEPSSLHLHYGPAMGGSLNINALNTGASQGDFEALPNISQSGSSVILGSASPSGSTANCSSVSFTWNSLTLLLSAGQLVDPEITASSTITTPLILKTQIQVIVSDLHHRTNDILRTWKLRRKGFTSPRVDSIVVCLIIKRS